MSCGARSITSSSVKAEAGAPHNRRSAKSPRVKAALDMGIRHASISSAYGTRQAMRILAPLLLFPFVASGLAPNAAAAMLTSGVPNPPWGGSVCADVAADNPGSGTHVQSWDCHGGPNQQFSFEGEQIYAMGGTMCLAVAGASTSPGASVQIMACNGTVAQDWVYLYNGSIVYYTALGINSHLCLDSTNQANGTQLVVNPCNLQQDGLPVPSQSWQIK